MGAYYNLTNELGLNTEMVHLHSMVIVYRIKIEKIGMVSLMIKFKIHAPECTGAHHFYVKNQKFSEEAHTRLPTGGGHFLPHPPTCGASTFVPAALSPLPQSKFLATPL